MTTTASTAAASSDVASHARQTIPGSDGDHSALDQDARALAEAADLLSKAETPEQLGAALAHNLDVWVAIKSIIGAERNPLPADVRANLNQLAVFIIRVTLGAETGKIKVSTIETLARINLHIAEGLAQSQRNRLVRDRAFHIWDEQGRPSGREVENWFQAEQEIQALLAKG